MQSLIGRHFSGQKHLVRASILDGILATICSMPFWALWLATSEDHAVTEFTTASGWTEAFGYFVGTIFCSMMAIIYLQRSHSLQPLWRSTRLTSIAVVTLTGLLTLVYALLNSARGPFDLWTALVTIGFTGVPAALRLTAPAPSLPKLGAASPEAIRVFGVEPGDSSGHHYQPWRQEP